jgi:signal transduction histidine kinase
VKERIPLRRRYYRDLGKMGSLVLGVCLVVLTAFNAVEYWEHRGSGPEEFMEMVILFVALVAMFPVVFFLAWRTSGRLLRPLQDMQKSVQRIRGGELDLQVKAEGADDELAFLVKSLNEAFGAHRSAQQRLEQFSADVSHQLRTPLTAMRTEGEVCLSQERSPEAYRKTLGTLLEQADRLSTVVDQLLMLAKVSASHGDPDFEDVDLTGLTEAVAEEYRMYCEDRDAELDVDSGSGDLWVNGNLWWLREAMSNLLNNALLYTPDPARFRIQVLKKDGKVQWILDDSGPGIPKERRDRIFQRFQQGTRRQVEGTGLGLPIVREVVSVHEGELRLEESPYGGCRFLMEFPAVEGIGLIG